MAMALYDSVDGVARKVVKKYASVDGVARKVLKCYDSVDGVARQYFSSGARFSRVSGWEINYDYSSMTSVAGMTISDVNFYFTADSMYLWFDCSHGCEGKWCDATGNYESVEHWEGSVYLIRDSDGYYIGVHPDDNPEVPMQVDVWSCCYFWNEETGEQDMTGLGLSYFELLNPDTFADGYLEIRVTCTGDGLNGCCGSATIRVTFE